MSAYKDKTQGTWYVSFRYIDWTGKKTQKLKRGFKTKKEALNYEKEFIRKTAADMKMEMNSFIQVYFEDKKNELKENSIRNKQHMMNKHIVPYFGTRKMNEITPAEIIQWQNTIIEKGYSDDYLKTIQNQMTALFNHAKNIYNLADNPCDKVKRLSLIHISEPTRLRRISYAVFCLEKTNTTHPAGASLSLKHISEPPR